jgi:hypothetical protein
VPLWVGDLCPPSTRPPPSTAEDGVVRTPDPGRSRNFFLGTIIGDGVVEL